MSNIHKMKLDDRYDRSFKLNKELTLDPNFSVSFSSAMDNISGAMVETLHLTKISTGEKIDVKVNTKTPPKVG